jgi:hypothetical protein
MNHCRLATLLLLGCLVLGVPRAQAQYYVNQAALAEILAPCGPRLDSLPEVLYDYYRLTHSRNNSVLARNTFFKVLGQGDIQLGKKRGLLVELLNRTLLQFENLGDTLIIPNRLDLDFCAYSPFPRTYEGGQEFPKLFIIEKSIQAWAAYEQGRLVRWGIVSSGGLQTPTPNGRFNFNWKEPKRISSLSPPGEEWLMRWVFNFHEARGIHIHEYAMPTGGPGSHGCVRLVEEDAKWIYNWADGWKTARGGTGFASAGGRVVEQGTTVLVLGEEPLGAVHAFDTSGPYPMLMQIELPASPWDVPPGTDQQVYFDQQRIPPSGDSKP